MRIAVGSDHRGYAVKQGLLPHLEALGHCAQDFGCDGGSGADYPDIACPLAMAVASELCGVGILIDGDGMGMSMVANKIHGVRAASASDEIAARRAREHHHCNVLVIGADLMGDKNVRRIIEVFLTATVAGGRHAQRIEKIQLIEEALAKAHTSKKLPPLWADFHAEPKGVFS